MLSVRKTQRVSESIYRSHCCWCGCPILCLYYSLCKSADIPRIPLLVDDLGVWTRFGQATTLKFISGDISILKFQNIRSWFVFPQVLKKNISLEVLKFRLCLQKSPDDNAEKLVVGTNWSKFRWWVCLKGTGRSNWILDKSKTAWQYCHVYSQSLSSDLTWTRPIEKRSSIPIVISWSAQCHVGLPLNLSWILRAITCPESSLSWKPFFLVMYFPFWRHSHPGKSCIWYKGMEGLGPHETQPPSVIACLVSFMLSSHLVLLLMLFSRLLIFLHLWGFSKVVELQEFQIGS